MRVIFCDCCERIVKADDSGDGKMHYRFEGIQDVCKPCSDLLMVRHDEACELHRELGKGLMKEIFRRTQVERKAS